MAAVLCANPARDRHEIAKGDRRVDLVFALDWGDDDLRASHSKPLSFCAFQCLAEWAAEKAGQHDGHVLKEGT